MKYNPHYALMQLLTDRDSVTMPEPSNRLVCVSDKYFSFHRQMIVCNAMHRQVYIGNGVAI